MFRTLCRYIPRFFFMFLLLVPAVEAQAVTGTQQLRFECLEPLTGDCELRVSPGPTRVVLNIRVVTQEGTPANNVAVTFTPSACCIEPAAAYRTQTDATGVASVVWSGTVVDEPIAVTVRAHATHDGNQHTILIAREPPLFRIDPVRHPEGRSYIWFRDELIPEPVSFEISKADASPITFEECNRVQVAFTPHLGGGAGPSPAHARWIQGEDRYRCIVGAQWRLAPVVGTQHLNAMIVGTHGPGRVDTNAAAISRHPPRFVAGMARVFGEEEAEDRFKGVFGIEFPVFPGLLPEWWRQRTRVHFGTSFDSPRDDFYGGIGVLPFVYGPSRDGLPVQVSANYARGDRLFGAVSIDAGTLLQLAVQRIAPGS